MIEFEGELSADSKLFIRKRERNVTFVYSIIFSLVFLILFIIISLKYDLLYLLFTPIFLVIIIGCTILPGKRALDYIIPQKIVFDNGWASCEGKKFYHVKRCNKIKKIIDVGGFYYIYFKFPYIASKFVCQKDLLKTGTLEEFEEMFKDKIIRKY